MEIQNLLYSYFRFKLYSFGSLVYDEIYFIENTPGLQSEKRKRLNGELGLEVWRGTDNTMSKRTNDKQTNNDRQSTTQKTEDWKIGTQLPPEDELKCFGRVGSYSSTSGTHKLLISYIDRWVKLINLQHLFVVIVRVLTLCVVNRFGSEQTKHYEIGILETSLTT